MSLLPERHRLVVFLAGKLAQRDRRWWRRVSWVDRIEEAKEIVSEWLAITEDDLPPESPEVPT